MISLLVVLVLSYLAGSFPTAILASKLILKDDIRNHGSGNAGATNVFRIMGWKVALVVVLMLIDTFLIGDVRSGMSLSRFGLTDRLSYDWPVLVSHIVLFACLISMSAIDLEHYWVDVRFKAEEMVVRHMNKGLGARPSQPSIDADDQLFLDTLAEVD